MYVRSLECVPATASDLSTLCISGFNIRVTVFLEPLSQSVLSVPYSVLGVFEGKATETFLSLE